MGNTKKLTLLNQNSKLKETSEKLGVKIFNFNLPAYKSETGKVVCPFADKCVQYCYARKGNYKRFAKTILPPMEKRLALSKTITFVPLMIEAITKKKADYIRIHDSGDFYSPKYLQKWLTIAESLPNVNFYAYTKSHDFFRGLNLPNNFDIIFSEGSKLDKKLNKETERHASIFDTKEALKKAGYIDASKVDLYATKFYSNNKKVGLIYH